MSADGDLAFETQVEAPTLATESVEQEGGLSFLKEEKSSEPCAHFRLDVAAGFGLCKCGHPKADHGAKAGNKAAEMLTNLKKKNNSGDAKDDEIDGNGDAPCKKFRLDTTAQTFGMCKCGFKRTDHVSRAESNAKKALEKLKESNLDKYKEQLTNLDADSPCDKYRVDTTAAEFGVCVCGFKRDDHVKKEENAASLLLKNLKKKNEERHERENYEAQGIVTEMPVPEETEPEVKTLNMQESKAQQAGGVSTPSKARKAKKKPCVIS